MEEDKPKITERDRKREKGRRGGERERDETSGLRPNAEGDHPGA